jgi:hypothetical protein
VGLSRLMRVGATCGAAGFVAAIVLAGCGGGTRDERVFTLADAARIVDVRPAASGWTWPSERKKSVSSKSTPLTSTDPVLVEFEEQTREGQRQVGPPRHRGLSELVGRAQVTGSFQRPLPRVRKADRARQDGRGRRRSRRRSVAPVGRQQQRRRSDLPLASRQPRHRSARPVLRIVAGWHGSGCARMGRRDRRTCTHAVRTGLIRPASAAEPDMAGSATTATWCQWRGYGGGSPRSEGVVSSERGNGP